ncbi:MAG: molybdopterin-dependent oxidoreductase [Pseudolabrys sp.]|nr:molybdopterin-dependent oxidoreductase [Pseudolabrys sp.]
MHLISRRGFLGTTAAAGAALIGGFGRFTEAQATSAASQLSPGVPDGIASYVQMGTLPGKQPLIQLADRPPNYESPLEYLQTPITPNDKFFVRYHLADIPKIKIEDYRIKVDGDGASTPMELTFDDLKKMPAIEIAAVNQCSGNRRGLSKPHVPGVEWGYGAMGCAKWKGPRLKDVLAKAGIKKEAIEVAFNGADGPVVDKTPDFIKSIPAWKAMDENTIIAYEMNGQPLPHFNGFPARLIVPGWTGTYWMKHLVHIDVRTTPQGGFWMKPAYRVPVGLFPLRDRFVTQEDATSTPITEMVVNSLITSHRDGAKVKAGKVTVAGLAWDGGYGIGKVEVSTDGGKTWSSAKLGEDLGKFAFRPWSFDVQARHGKTTVLVNATNAIGQTQVTKLLFNGAGYHNNVMQSITLTA